MTLDLKALREKYALLTGWGYQAEVLALIDELTEARQREHRAAERAGEWMAQNESLIRAKREAEAALAHARAAAFEEAARLLGRNEASERAEGERLAALGSLASSQAAHNRASDSQLLAERIRALSATPATVVCVPVEELAAAVSEPRDCSEECCDGKALGVRHFGLSKAGKCSSCTALTAEVVAHNEKRMAALAALVELAQVKP